MPPHQLVLLDDRFLVLRIEIRRQIPHMHPTRRLLAAFQAHDRQVDLPGQHLALELFRREVAEVVRA
ncbi:hypothetical protein D3C84_1024450 [compost metagenome]